MWPTSSFLILPNKQTNIFVINYFFSLVVGILVSWHVWNVFFFFMFSEHNIWTGSVGIIMKIYQINFKHFMVTKFNHFIPIKQKLYVLKKRHAFGLVFAILVNWHIWTVFSKDGELSLTSYKFTWITIIVDNSASNCI